MRSTARRTYGFAMNFRNLSDEEPAGDTCVRHVAEQRGRLSGAEK
jgi:hypothetical protein